MKGDTEVVIAIFIGLLCFIAGLSVSGDFYFEVSEVLTDAMGSLGASAAIGVYVALVTIRYQEICRLSEMARASFGTAAKYDVRKGVFHFVHDKSERFQILGDNYGLAIQGMKKAGYFPEAENLEKIHQYLVGRPDVSKAEPEKMRVKIRGLKQQIEDQSFHWRSFLPVPVKWSTRVLVRFNLCKNTVVI